MVRNYCTECLSLYGNYYNLKVLSERFEGKSIATGVYRCESCGLIAVDYYKELRDDGNITVRKFEEVREQGWKD